MAKEKLSKKEIMNFGKAQFEICRNMTNCGIESFSKEIVDPKTGKRYYMTITELV